MTMRALAAAALGCLIIACGPVAGPSVSDPPGLAAPADGGTPDARAAVPDGAPPVCRPCSQSMSTPDCAAAACECLAGACCCREVRP